MRAALATQPVLDFPQPDTVVAILIDPTTGQLATPDCPEPRVEFYSDGTQPTTACPAHGAPAAETSPEEPPEPAAGAAPYPFLPAEAVP
jgi:membrane carboxypeptidase/penicillin-binding protein